MKRIPPSVQVREELSQLLEKGTEGHPLDEVFTLSARLMLQEALEGELTAYLGRAHYRRGGGRPGWRNGYEPRRLRTAEGTLLVYLPQVRGTEELGKNLPGACSSMRLPERSCRSPPPRRRLAAHPLPRRSRPLPSYPGGLQVAGLTKGFDDFGIQKKIVSGSHRMGEMAI